MTRILLLGDTHGKYDHLTKAARFAKRMECEAILQLGDFGFIWPNSTRKLVEGKLERILEADDHKLASLDAHMAEFGLKLYWLDGNHEDFDAMERLGLFDPSGAKPDGPIPYGENLFYLPRGATWKFDGVRFLALGGAVSVDKGRRTNFVSWWQQERTREADVENAKAVKGPIDIMVTHDSPGLPGRLHEFVYGNPWTGTQGELDSRENQNKILSILRHHRPRALFHGHFHYPYVEEVEGVKVRGLDCTPGQDAWWVFDTDEYKEGVLR